MEEQILENIPVLSAHRYPLWIKLFAAGIALAILYSLILLPKYLMASRKMNAARMAYQSGNYEESAQLYRDVLRAVPSSKIAHIGAAESIFSNTDKDDDEVGLFFLYGIAIDKDAWSRIERVMPVEYQQYFEDVKK